MKNEPYWEVTITYRTETGPHEEVTQIDEIEEADGLVEGGPHWDTIESIVIKRVNSDYPNLTVEAAENL
jgi:hypothetical protein